MRKVILSAVAAIALGAPRAAADQAPALPAPPNPWDVAYGGGITSDYIFRGITQSNHKPSIAVYFEPRYNVTKDLQLYVGVSGESISFPNHAAVEIDGFAGIRPTVGPFALDFGVWYYWYPGGQCFNGSIAPVFSTDCLSNGYLPTNGNVIKKDLSFWEVYAKGTYTVNDQVSFGAATFYSPSVANSGADGVYVSSSAKFTVSRSAMPEGWGLFLYGEVGYWILGRSDNFYCTQVDFPGCTAPFPHGIPYPSYTTWNIGISVTNSVFTLDLRYYDTDLRRGECNAFTSDHTASFTASFSPINPGGFGSNWCGATFVATGKFDLTANLK